MADDLASTQRVRVRGAARALNQLRVLDAILDYPSARTQGYVWATTADIGARSGCPHEGDVRGAMRSLRDRGVIRYGDRRTAPVGGLRKPILLGRGIWPHMVPYLPDEAINTLVHEITGAPLHGWPSPAPVPPVMSGGRPAGVQRRPSRRNNQWGRNEEKGHPSLPVKDEASGFASLRFAHRDAAEGQGAARGLAG
jgi:hypothetical protein